MNTQPNWAQRAGYVQPSPNPLYLIVGEGELERDRFGYGILAEVDDKEFANKILQEFLKEGKAMIVSNSNYVRELISLCLYAKFLQEEN